MAVPKRKKSKSRTKMRRSKYRVSLPDLVPCPNCKKPKLPHKVCKECGYYNGRQVLTIKEASSKKSK